MIKTNKNIQIIACGLNYYRPHKFRSKVILDFGKPYIVSE